MNIMSQLHVLMPELTLLLTALAVLVGHLFVAKERATFFSYCVAQLGMVAVILILLELTTLPTQIIMAGSFKVDQLALLLKMAIATLSLAILLYSKSYIEMRDFPHGEYFALALLSTVGMMVLVSANNLLVVYLGLELMSLPLYAMVALCRTSETAPEAGMKYFVLGAIASAMLLYGISLIYGVTHSLQHDHVVAALSAVTGEQKVVAGLGIVFILVALAFKVGAVPFHMWVPDVYEGAPMSVTMFIGAAPKIAAFGMIIRVLAEGLATGVANWQPILMILAVLSMGLGNLLALSQTNIKRLFAYSAIAHAGFMLMGIMVANETGYSASLFYILIYALTVSGGFGMIIMLSRSGTDAELITDLKGLNARSPWTAFLMMILVFTMAGVPPTAGFYAKLVVLESVVNAGYYGVAIFAVIMAVIGAFYYLRLIHMMYFEQPEDPIKPQSTMGLNAVLSINGLLPLLIGLSPAVLMSLCMHVFAVQ